MGVLCYSVDFAQFWVLRKDGIISFAYKLNKHDCLHLYFQCMSLGNILQTNGGIASDSSEDHFKNILLMVSHPAVKSHPLSECAIYIRVAYWIS